MTNQTYHQDDDKHSFDLPADYFTSFEDKLRKKMETQEELKEFPVLLSVSKKNVFAIPVGYFAEAGKTLELKTELSSYPELKNLKPFVPAELTAEYTKQLHSSLQYKVELSNELKPYERLYNINKVNPFVISDSYFESLGDKVKEKIHAVKESRTPISDTVLDFIFGKKVAFAFGLSFMICLSVYFYESKEIPMETGDCKTLACLERQEILNNNVISDFDEDQLMDLVDVNSLKHQLNSKTDKPHTSNEQMHTDSVSEEDLLDEL